MPKTDKPNILVIWLSSCPLIPQDRTLTGHRSVSAKCHERPFAPRQNDGPCDHLVGEGKQSW
jgi:hypothetical protein